MLYKSCAALLAATVLTATPALGRDKTLYLGVELGPSWASSMDADVEIEDDGDVFEEDFFDIDHKMGYDVGVIFGYDAGIVRAELDLSYKRWSHDEYEVDFDGLTDVDADGNTRYVAIMTNLLLDVGNEDGFSFYAGPGVGFAWGKFDIEDELGDDFTIKDGGVAWQLIAGVRYALNENVDLGLKYRYFHPSKVTEDLTDDGDIRASGRMHSHSLLATLTYNFYTPEPPPPPPPPPPPEPERG